MINKEKEEIHKAKKRQIVFFKGSKLEDRAIRNIKQLQAMAKWLGSP